MSLLRASGLRCHIRSLRLAQRGGLASRARHYSDDADSSSWDPEKVVCSPINWSAMRSGSHSFAARRPGLITISQEVLTAMQTRKPILGLETAIYTHGFPKPNNYHLALEMEAVVRENGVTPATIGILNGKIMIGMTSEQLKELTESAGSENTHKISRRDLAYHIAASGQPLNGGTTIAGTILLSRMAGIQIIATGGLGGVHKGGENSLDISADLTELSRGTIAVVTSGMKSFLDTPRTLEYLETQGVFVSTFGKKTEKVDIPGFFSRESGYQSPYVVESPEEAARIFFANHRLGLGSGNLYFNPIPEEYEIPKSEMDPIIAAAVEKSSSVTGKDNTPAVLAEIVKQTEGRSIEANRQLVLDNAKIGAQMAVELSRLSKEYKNAKNEHDSTHRSKNKKKPNKTSKPKTNNPSTEESNPPVQEPPKPATDSTIKGTNGILRTGTLNPRTSPNPLSDRRSFSTLNKPEPDVRALDEESKPEPEPTKDTTQVGEILVVGGVGVDVVAKADTKELQLRASNPGVVTSSVGGVAKNIAATLSQLNPAVPVGFLSAVGKDINGIRVLQELQRLDISTEDVARKEGARTACYAAMNSDDVEGGLSAAVADMDVIKNIPKEDIVAAVEKYKPRIVCFDGNLSTDAMRELCTAAKAQGALVVCEPTSKPKSQYIADMLADLGNELEYPVDIISPNFDELNAIADTVIPKPPTSKNNSEKANPKVQANFQNYQTIVNSESMKTTIARLKGLLKSTRKGRFARYRFEYPNETTIANCITKSIKLLHLVPTIITKLGKHGVMIVRTVKHPRPAEATIRAGYAFLQDIRDEKSEDNRNSKDMRVVLDLFLPVESYNPEDQIIGIHVFWAPAVKLLEASEVVSSNGAGDTFLGAFLHSLLNKNTWVPGNLVASPWVYFEGEQLAILVHKAQQAAVKTLKRHESHPIRKITSYEHLRKQQEEKMWGQFAKATKKIFGKPKERGRNKKKDSKVKIAKERPEEITEGSEEAFEGSEGVVEDLDEMGSKNRGSVGP